MTCDTYRLWDAYRELVCMMETLDHFYGMLFGRVVSLPRDYVVLVADTTGLDSYMDRVVEVGIVDVQGTQVVSRQHYVVDIFDSLSGVSAEQLAGRMEHTRQAMRGSGRAYYPTPERCQEYGITEESCLRQLEAAMPGYDATSPELAVGYGLLGPIATLLDQMAQRQGWDSVVPYDHLLDLMAVIRAAICDDDEYLPTAQETPAAWSQRVMRSPIPGDGHGLALYPDVVSEFRVGENFECDPRRMQSAAGRAMLISHVLESMRDMAETI